jgi:hypothetical protein
LQLADFIVILTLLSYWKVLLVDGFENKGAEMSLGDFIKQLVAKLHKDGVKIPYEDERSWHELFFELKRSGVSNKPSFIGGLRFDWDGPFPKCQELSEFVHALHWNASVIAHNPAFDTITLQEEIAARWLERTKSLTTDETGFLNSVVESAKQKFEAALSVG